MMYIKCMYVFFFFFWLIMIMFVYSYSGSWLVISSLSLYPSDLEKSSMQYILNGKKKKKKE